MCWIPLTDHLSVDQREGYRNQSIELDPGNPEVVYVVLREGTLLKSLDRGDNWIELKMNIATGSSLW